MQIELPAQTLAWQQQVRDYVENTLIPREIAAEMNAGELPADVMRDILDGALALGLPGMDAPASHGGLGLGMVDQVAAWEVLGRVTNALCWCFPEAQSWMYEACADSQYQLDTYIRPLLEGKRREAYAITEAESGSHEVINTSAEPHRGGYRINGEKWFVTSGNLADYFFVQARTEDGSDARGYGGLDGLDEISQSCSPDTGPTSGAVRTLIESTFGGAAARAAFAALGGGSSTR